MTTLVTGCAGFIGFHLTQRLLKQNIKVLGIDNINSYYDKSLKLNRLKILKKNKKNFKFLKLDITKKKKLFDKLKKYKIKLVINLAAQAGVRYSIKFPDEYIKNNINGFYNILEFVKEKKIKKLLFASSSSVYGNIKIKKFSEILLTENQISLYAVSKKINELMAKFYSNTYGVSALGMRFFTVYGPFGRPDMSIYKFTKAILEKKYIYLNNYGNHSRDFTYVDDCVECIYKLIEFIKKKNNFFNIVNVAGGRKVKITKVVKQIEKNFRLKAKIKYKPLQFGDIPETLANTKNLKKLINFVPKTKIEDGIKNFCNWYKKFY